MLLKPAPTVHAPARSEPTVERPHLFDLVLALIDARVSHVDILDTEGAAELERYYRARRAAHRAGRAHESGGGEGHE